MMAASAWALPYWVWVDSHRLVSASTWHGYCCSDVGVGSLYLSISPLYLSVSPHYLSISFLFIFPSSFTFSVRFTVEFSSFFFFLFLFFFYFFFLLFTWVMGSYSWAGQLGLEFRIFGRGTELKTQPIFFFFFENFNLLIFFFGPREGPGLLWPLPGSILQSHWCRISFHVEKHVIFLSFMS